MPGLVRNRPVVLNRLVVGIVRRSRSVVCQLLEQMLLGYLLLELKLVVPERRLVAFLLEWILVALVQWEVCLPV